MRQMYGSWLAYRDMRDNGEGRLKALVKVVGHPLPGLTARFQVSFEHLRVRRYYRELEHVGQESER